MEMLGFKDIFSLRRDKPAVTPPVSFLYPAEHVGESEALGLSAVYACVELISNSIAQLPLEPYALTSEGKRKDPGSPVYSVLSYAPNEDMTRFDLLKSLVVSVLLKGNGYAYIERDAQGYAKALHFQNPSDVFLLTAEGRHGKRIASYYNSALDRVITPRDMLHIRNLSMDGFLGISTLESARRTLGLSLKAERQAEQFFTGSGNLVGVLSTEKGRLTDEQRKAIRRSWIQAVNPHTGGDGVAILEQGMSYQAIGVNPSDTQLLESRAFSITEICRFFNVSPVKVHDLSKSSYSTVEATNIAFLTDTLSPYLVKIELEMRRKVFPAIAQAYNVVEFDTSALIRADSNAQAMLYRTLANIGAITPNEVRSNFNLPPIEGGDEAYIQVNMSRISDLPKGYHDERQ